MWHAAVMHVQWLRSGHLVFVRVLLALPLGVVLAGCGAPLASLRPIGALTPERRVEVGAAYTGVGPRPYAEESWQSAGQAWTSLRLGRVVDLSAVTAFDASGFALGGAAKFAFVRGSRVWLGAEAEAGWLWAAAVLHASLRIADQLLVYTAPRLGNYGKDLTPGIPVGVNVPIYGGLVLRAEGQVNWAKFKYYNRRVLAAGGLAYQW